MPYLLNLNRHANLPHPELGIVPPKTAVKITDKQAMTLKNIVNTIVFNNIIDFTEKEVKKVEVEPIDIEKESKVKSYQDFVAETKDVKEASRLWKEYKEKHDTG